MHFPMYTLHIYQPILEDEGGFELSEEKVSQMPFEGQHGALSCRSFCDQMCVIL